MLNTLIAILGDSYDNVMNEAAAFDMKQKLVLLVELNNFMMLIVDEEKASQDKNYIIIIRYIQNEKTQNAF